MPSISEEVRLPHTQLDVGTGEQIKETDLVEFRLLYEGELLPTGNKSRVSEVHTIRRSFHPQLRRLWGAEGNLREIAKRQLYNTARHFEHDAKPIPEQEQFDSGIKLIGAMWNRVGFEWVPLVTAQFSLRCRIDVLLLRPDIEERFIFRRGDIDGQTKTLFDALRMPASTGETGGATPQDGETPFFCLLEDDRLITEVRVTTDRLLLLPHEIDVKPNDCLAIIHVKLNHKSWSRFNNNWFG